MRRIAYVSEEIKFNREKIYAIMTAVIFFLTICFLAIMNGAFERVLYYVSERFFSSMLPTAYYGDNVSLSGDIQSELLPVMTALSEDEEDSYYDFDLVVSDSSSSYGDIQETGYENNIVRGEESAIMETDENASIQEISGEIDMEADLSGSTAVPAQSFGITPLSYNGTVYTLDQISDYDFLINNIFAVDKSASVTTEELNGANLQAQDMSIDLTGDDYKVLIYHTHGSETFIDSREGVLEDTIIGVGDTLTELLEQYGIKVYHDRTVYDIVDGKLDRSYAYNQASDGVDKILEEYPSIEVVIDLHRDGVQDDVHLVTNIDGRPTAKIMFLNGVSRSKKNGDLEHLYNPNKIANLAFSLQMYLEGKKISNDYVRKIYIKMYRFNLEKRPRSTLIEVGAQTNTLEEEKNAMIPLAAILYSVLSGE